ncbi:MAG: DUF6079 family protein, partial [Armatimonadota bacterium]
GEELNRLVHEGVTEEELAASYPLHPLTMRCLEATSEQLWSRARSAIDFVTARVAGDPGRSLPGILDQDYRTLVTPDALFDHFRGSLVHHQRLGPYASEVYDYFVKNVASVVESRAGLALRTVKTLIILRAANLEATVRELAECVMLSEPRGEESDEDTMLRVLEALATRGNYVQAKRAEGTPDDVYFIDAQPSPADVAQRQVRAVKGALSDDDARIEAYAREAASGDVFPIGRFAEKGSVEVDWENTRRRVSVVHVNLASLTTSDLVDTATWLRSPDTAEDVQVFIGALFKPDEQLRHWHEITEALDQGRWAHALIAWVPRAPKPSELDRLKDYAAAQMLHRGASGERAGAADASRDVAALLRDVYCAGVAFTAGRTALEPGTLSALKNEWPAVLRRLAALGLDAVFPRFHECAPAARLSGDAEIARLCEDFIFAPEPAADLPAELDTAVRSYLEPLGVVSRGDDGMQLSAVESEVAGAVEHAITSRDPTDRAIRGRPVPVGRILGQMAKSEFGLPAALTRLIIAVLLRCGHIVALDPRQRPLPAETPLDRIGYVARAPLLTHNEWRDLAGATRVILGEGVLAPNLATQQRIWDRLIGEKRRQSEELVELSADLDRLCKWLGQERGQWSDAYDALEEARAFFACIDPSLPAAEGLRELLAGCRQLYVGEPVGPSLRALSQKVNAISKFFERAARELADTYEYVQNASVPEDKSSILAPARERLLGFIADGERVVGEWRTFQRLAQAFLGGYMRAYLAWHQRVHNSPEFQQYDKLRSTPAYRALARLAQLDLPARIRLEDVERAINEQLAKQCANPELKDDIKTRPVCPKCGLSLAAPLGLQSVDELAAFVAEGLADHLATLQRPQTRSALLDHAAGLPNDLAQRMKAIAELAPDASPTRVLPMLTDDIILHVKRALSGRAVHGRQIDDLRKRLSRRTLTKSAIASELRAWLDQDDELPEDELIYVE